MKHMLFSQSQAQGCKFGLSSQQTFSGLPNLPGYQPHPFPTSLPSRVYSSVKDSQSWHRYLRVIYTL